jgi:drug/metabolite transporter (DMT)-like permease
MSSNEVNLETQRLVLNTSHNHSNYLTIKETNESIDLNSDTSKFDLFKGLFYMFLSCLFKSIFSILSKYTLKDRTDLSSFQLMSYRVYFMLWISLSIILLFDTKILTNDLFKLKTKLISVIIRSLFAIVSMSMVIYSIKFMHISDVYSVYYIYPGFVILFSFVLLRERIQLLDGICLAACIIGAILIVKPGFIFTSDKPNTNLVYFGFVLIAALLKASEDVIVRNSGKEVHFLIYPLMYSVLGIVLFPIPMFLFDTTYPTFNLTEVFVLFFIALSSFCYQAFMVLGIQNEKAGRVSMVNYLQVALMYITDITMFHKSVQVLDLVGTLLIFSFNFINGLLKVKKRLNELNKFKLKK